MRALITAPDANDGLTTRRFIYVCRLPIRLLDVMSTDITRALSPYARKMRACHHARSAERRAARCDDER